MTNQPAQAADLSALSGLAPQLAATLAAVAGDIALVLDANGVIRNVAMGRDAISPAADGWVGRAWADTVTGDTRRKIQLLLEEVSDHGVTKRREVNIPGRAGPDIPVAYAAIRLGEGGPVLAVGRDLRAIAAIQQRFVESQHDMEREYWKRRQADERYRQLFHVATDAVLVVDALTLTIVEANQAAAQLFGQASAELAGRPATLGLDAHSPRRRRRITSRCPRHRPAGRNPRAARGPVRWRSTSPRRRSAMSIHCCCWCAPARSRPLRSRRTSVPGWSISSNARPTPW